MKNTMKKNGAKRILATAIMAVAMIPTAAVMMPGLTASASHTEITAEQSDRPMYYAEDGSLTYEAPADVKKMMEKQKTDPMYTGSDELVSTGKPDLRRAFMITVKNTFNSIFYPEERNIPVIGPCDIQQ